MKRSTGRIVIGLAGISISIALLMGCVGFGFAYVRANPEPQQARNTINRTTVVLQDAQNAIRDRRVYTGSLAAAYSSQQYARDLFDRGEYHASIEYSLYARRLGYQSLQANRARYRVIRYGDESGFVSRSDSELNNEIRAMRPNQPTDDQTVLTLRFDLNF